MGLGHADQTRESRYIATTAIPRGSYQLRAYPVTPSLRKKGRSYYPDNQGIICKAWRNEFYKYQFNSEDGTDELWLKEQYELFAVPNDVARRFVMKSHSCVALRLEHRDTKIGVLVIESTNKDRADAKLMETVLGSSHFPPLKRALYRVNESHVRNMAKLADRE